MTKKKIAQQKKSSKSSGRRSGKAGAPIPFVPAEEPVDDEIRKAADRAGVEAVDPYGAAVRHVMSRVGELIVKACDQLGEEIAAIADAPGEGLPDNANVVDALLTLWRVRWELGMTHEAITVDAEPAEHLVKRYAKQATAGAS